MNLIRIDHVSLDTTDRARTIAFYEQVLGLRGEAAAHTPAEEPVFLGPPGARLGLFEDRPRGLRHVALATDDATQATVVQTMRALDIPFRAERHRDSYSVYFADPDGTTVELMVPVP